MTQDLKYSIRISPLPEDDGGGYLVEVPDLPGCATDGDTLEKAVAKIPDAIESWIKTAKKLGRPVPTAKLYTNPDDFSGKLTLRMPKTLHRELVQVSVSEGISLNQLIIYYLGKGIGRDLGIQRKVTSQEKQSSIINQIHLYYIQNNSVQIDSIDFLNIPRISYTKKKLV